MTRTENDIVQALRTEVNLAFASIQESITTLAVNQASHIAAHDERDKMRREEKADDAESAITRRWVVQVVVSTVGIAVALTSLIFGIATKILNV